jgi:carboxypeptidase C (cathepsin A)
MYGLFSENGPFSVSTTGNLVPNPYRWTKQYSMIYIGMKSIYYLFYDLHW